MRKNSRPYQASFTVEMAYLMPLIFMVLFVSVMGIFYFHDKNIITGCAYETAVIGSTKAREKDGVTEGTLSTLFQERVEGKCILFGHVQTSIQVGKEDITVQASAQAKKMRVFVQQTAKVTEPEKHIRDIRRIKQIGK